MDKRLLLVIVAAVAITLVGSGAFVLLSLPADTYYSHVYSSPESVSPGAPIVLQVSLSEIRPSTTESFTYFNARSVKVKIDGEEFADFRTYPNFGGLVNSPLAVNTALPSIGAVCCYNTCNSACSVCSDQDRNGAQSDRAFLFGDVIPQGESLKGKNLFSVVIPQQLSAGKHNVEVFYYSQTMGNANWKSCGITYGSELSGNTYGDQNGKYNYHAVFDVDVVDSSVPPVVPPVTPPVIPPVNPPIVPPEPAFPFVLLIALGAGVYLVYVMWIRKK